MSTRSVTSLECAGRRILIRVDFNVPLAPDRSILDDRRIRMALPTVEHVIGHGGVAILMSHLGRPAGTGPEDAWSMAPVAERLAELLGPAHPVRFVPGDCTGAAVESAVASAGPGDIVLLDNLRFSPMEKRNDADFSAALAGLGDAYVNDAFGTAHRDHASMVGVPRAMPDAPCVAGLLLARELRFLSESISDPKRPFVAILGGAKVSDKLGAIRNLLPRVDSVLVGGGMAYTFLKAQGEGIGESLLEEDMLETAAALQALAAQSGTDLLLPGDHLCAATLEGSVGHRVCEIGIPPGLIGLDIGPETADAWAEVVHHAGTVVWNGPVGVFETPPFDTGTTRLARAMAEATRRHKSVTIVGGGETAAAVELAGVADELSHVSTGGGASLRMLEGIELCSVSLLDSH